MPGCPNCGYDADPGTELCPLCGSELARGSPGPAGDRGEPDREAGDAGPAPGEGPVAWEDPREAFPRNVWSTWTESLTEPSRFFRRVSHEEPFVRPVLYFLLISVAGAFFTLLWNAALGAAWMPGLERAGGRVDLLFFLLTPFLALVGLAITTGVYHVAVGLLAPDRRGPAATARVLCYAVGPTAFSVVPFLGPLVAMVWGPILQVIGLREVHRTTTFRAVLVLVIPFTALVLGLVLLGVLAYMAADAGGVAPLPGT